MTSAKPVHLLLLFSFIFFLFRVFFFATEKRCSGSRNTAPFLRFSCLRVTSAVATERGPLSVPRSALLDTPSSETNRTGVASAPSASCHHKKNEGIKGKGPKRKRVRAESGSATGGVEPVVVDVESRILRGEEETKRQKRHRYR